MESEINNTNLPEQNPPAQPPSPDLQAQTLTTEESCRQLGQYLEDILRDAGSAHLDMTRLSQPFQALGEALGSFRSLAEELVAYSTQLSKGDLSQAFPESGSCLYNGLKNLHTNLKHLTWQATQVAKGDYSQHVSHLGEFSEVFNAMTRQLQKRETQLKQEVQRARRRMEIIESYTEMLIELLDQRDEWLLVVDQETREIVRCNKRTQRGGEDSEYCDACQHRLSIQPKLLEWNGSERYQVWEQTESRGRCYRIISFPIEWRERPSCVHIVMDVSTEKMNARHLSDEIYQDADTGIRNRLFLEEFMEHILQDRLDITLCYLDLEGVSEINTVYGRKVGDAYIQNFVEIVRKHFRSSDTFVRIQDDKFCLILTGNVKHLIERKMNEILTLFQRDDDRVFCHRCNFKYSIVEVEGASNVLTLDTLLENAEAVIQRKKRRQQRERKVLGFDDW